MKSVMQFVSLETISRPLPHSEGIMEREGCGVRETTAAAADSVSEVFIAGGALRTPTEI